MITNIRIVQVESKTYLPQEEDSTDKEHTITGENMKNQEKKLDIHGKPVSDYRGKT